MLAACVSVAHVRHWCLSASVLRSVGLDLLMAVAFFVALGVALARCSHVHSVCLSPCRTLSLWRCVSCARVRLLVRFCAYPPSPQFALLPSLCAAVYQHTGARVCVRDSGVWRYVVCAPAFFFQFFEDQLNTDAALCAPSLRAGASLSLNLLSGCSDASLSML